MLRFLQTTKAYNPIYQRYRWIALAIYLAVLLAGIIDWVYGGIGPSSIVKAPEQLRFFIFVSAMLILIGLELRDRTQAAVYAVEHGLV